VYDETEEAMSKLYEELYKRAKEDVSVSLTLRMVVRVFKLNQLDEDGYDEEPEHNDIDHTNASSWAQLVQRRQRSIVDRDRDREYIMESPAECEKLLWRVVHNTTDTSELYERLIMLEGEYKEMLEYGNTLVSRYNSDRTTEHVMTLSESLYNSMNSGQETEPILVVLNDLVPPAFGVVELELERVYLQDSHMERDSGNRAEEEFQDYVDEAEELLLKVCSEEVLGGFECPICYEGQEVGGVGVRTMCGHSYCSPCFSGMVSRKAECGMCRSVIREYVELTVVESGAGGAEEEERSEESR
jgi:hypothetical protein